jgi:hypothetical protein
MPSTVIIGESSSTPCEPSQAKRRELRSAQHSTREIDNVIAALLHAAALYRRQIAEGLDGHPQFAARARLLLREIFGGKMPLKRQGRELWAHIELRPEALLLRAEGTDGSGGLLW